MKEYREEVPFQNFFLSRSSPPDTLFKLTSFLPEGLVFQSGQEKREVSFKEKYLWRVKFSSSQEISHLFLFTQKKEERFYSRYQEIFYQEEAQFTRISRNKIKRTLLINNPKYIGARDRYYACIFLNPPPGEYRFFVDKKKNQLELEFTPQKPSQEFVFNFFLGPQKIKILKKYGLERIIYFGFFNGISKFLLNVLYFLHSFLRNWGLSIICLSLLIYFVLFPLTAKSTQSIKKTQKLQPLIEEIRKKYKDNPEKLQREMIALYKEHKLNPLGGCLPLFLQLPIFFALYQVLIRSVEIKGASFLWIKDLSQPDYIPLPFLEKNFHLLPLLMVGIMFFQQKLTTPSSQASEQQKMIGWLFPLFLGIIFYNFPSGLVLYWLTNSFLTFLYQWRLSKSE